MQSKVYHNQAMVWVSVTRCLNRGGRLTLTEYFRDKFLRVTLTKMVAMATSK